MGLGDLGTGDGPGIEPGCWAMGEPFRPGAIAPDGVGAWAMTHAASSHLGSVGGLTGYSLSVLSPLSGVHGATPSGFAYPTSLALPSEVGRWADHPGRPLGLPTHGVLHGTDHVRLVPASCSPRPRPRFTAGLPSWVWTQLVSSGRGGRAPYAPDRLRCSVACLAAIPAAWLEMRARTTNRPSSPLHRAHPYPPSPPWAWRTRVSQVYGVLAPTPPGPSQPVDPAFRGGGSTSSGHRPGALCTPPAASGGWVAGHCPAVHQAITNLRPVRPTPPTAGGRLDRLISIYSMVV